MKHFVSALALLAVFRVQCALAEHAAQTPGSNEEAAVDRVVDEIVATEGRNDADALDRLYVADYTFVTPAGQVWSKARYLGLMRSCDLN